MTSLAPTLTRRSFAAFSCAVPALAAVGAARPDAEEVEALLHASAQLTGFAADGLDAEFAASLLDALRASERDQALAALLGGESVPALEEDIISAWYTGMLPLPSGPVVAALQDALVWQVAAFAQPRGVCAGVASWAAPPPNTQSGGRPAA